MACAPRVVPAPGPARAPASEAELAAWAPVWRAALSTLRASAARPDTTASEQPVVLHVPPGGVIPTPPPPWVLQWQLDDVVDGFSASPPCEAQRKAVVGALYVTLAAPEVWRPDTVVVTLGLEDLYPAWTAGTALADGARWGFGSGGREVWLARAAEAWVVIRRPAGVTGRAIQLHGDGFCEP